MQNMKEEFIKNVEILKKIKILEMNSSITQKNSAESFLSLLF
jgi:hypothetical protein